MQGRHIAPGNLRKLYLVQRLGMLRQMPLYFLERSGPKALAQGVEILVHVEFEGFGHLAQCIGFVGRGIFAAPDAGVMLQGQLADFGKVQRRRFAERHAAMLGAELVLEDEAPRSALTQSKPEAGNIIVKENRFGFACGQLCRLHCRRRQFHVTPPNLPTLPSGSRGLLISVSKSSQSSQIAGLFRSSVFGIADRR